MNKKEIIEQAINLISDPNKWTKAAYARNSRGEPVKYLAVCWCAMGAVEKCCSDLEIYFDIYSELSSFCVKNYNQSIEAINDTLGREEVIDVLKEYSMNLN